MQIEVVSALLSQFCPSWVGRPAKMVAQTKLLVSNALKLYLVIYFVIVIDSTCLLLAAPQKSKPYDLYIKNRKVTTGFLEVCLAHINPSPAVLRLKPFCPKSSPVKPRLVSMQLSVYQWKLESLEYFTIPKCSVPLLNTWKAHWNYMKIEIYDENIPIHLHKIFSRYQSGWNLFSLGRCIHKALVLPQHELLSENNKITQICAWY